VPETKPPLLKLGGAGIQDDAEVYAIPQPTKARGEMLAHTVRNADRFAISLIVEGESRRTPVQYPPWASMVTNRRFSPAAVEKSPPPPAR